jgi:hypothetical protein
MTVKRYTKITNFFVTAKHINLLNCARKKLHLHAQQKPSHYLPTKFNAARS